MAVTRVCAGLEAKTALLTDLPSSEAGYLRIGATVAAAWNDHAPRVFRDD